MTSRTQVYPAHNRLADTERVSVFAFPVIMHMLRRIMLETAGRHAGEPAKWVPAAFERFRLLAMDWNELASIVHDKLNVHVPPPDEDGLVNLAVFVDMNPRLFPSFHDPALRNPFDSSSLALPQMPRD